VLNGPEVKLISPEKKDPKSTVLSSACPSDVASTTCKADSINLDSNVRVLTKRQQHVYASGL
jgi:hypothetical protein